MLLGSKKRWALMTELSRIGPEAVEPGEPPALRRLEQLLEMLALAVIDDVQDPVGLPVLEAPADRGQVGGGVEEGAVGLADEERRRVVAAEEHADRAAALAGQAARDQIVHHGDESPKRMILLDAAPLGLT